MAGIFPASSTYTITGVLENVDGSDGSGTPSVYVYINLYSFKITTNSFKDIYNIQVNFRSGSTWSGSSPTGNFNYSMYINGVTVISPVNDGNGFEGDYPSLVGTIPTYPIGSSFLFRFNTNAQRSVFGATKSIGLDAIYTIQTLNPDTDLLVVDSSLGKNIVLLPDASNVTTGKLFFIKDVEGNASTNKIVVACNTTETVNSGGRTSFNIDANYGCLTIVSDGSQWQVVNYYPSTNQPTIPFSTYTGGTSSASVGYINIFRTDTPVTRETGHNGVLRSGSSSAGVWIVIYAGRGYTDNRNSSNRLFLQDSVGIDGYSASNYPYLECDGAAGKTVGAVLIYDGNKSYIAGWYNPNSNWVLLGGFIGLGGSWTGGTTNVNPTNTPALIGVIPTTNKDVEYSLSATLAAGDACFFNINKLEGAGNSGVAGNTFSTFTSGITPILNNTFNGIAGSGAGTYPITAIRYEGNQTNSAVWIISVPSVQLRINASDRENPTLYLGNGNVSFTIYASSSNIVSNIRVGAIATASGFNFTEINFTNGFIRSFVQSSINPLHYTLVCFNPLFASSGTPFADNSTTGVIDIQYSLISYPIIAYTPGA